MCATFIDNEKLLTLIWVGGNFTPPPLPGWFFWLSLIDNSETVKFITFHSAAFNNISLEIFEIPNSLQSPDIGQNSHRGISDFRISGQYLIKENCHNSRTSDDIDMKIGAVIKLDKRNKTMLKKIDDDIILANCDVIVIFSIFD